MEINEAIIIFIVGLVFGRLIDWAIEISMKRMIDKIKELKKGE